MVYEIALQTDSPVYPPKGLQKGLQNWSQIVRLVNTQTICKPGVKRGDSCPLSS